MATNFSFSRLFQVIKKQWFENSRLYIFSTLALLGLMALTFSFWAANAGRIYREEDLYIIFLAGLFISGCIFASMSFNVLGDKTKGTYWLAFPASHTEKLLCVIFYHTILFVLMYCACFFLVKAITVSYVEGLVRDNPSMYQFIKADFNSGFGRMVSAFLYGFVAIQAFYLLGSVYFSRYAFILTTIVGAALIFIFFYYGSKLNNAFFSKEYSWEMLSVRQYENNWKSFRQYELPSFSRDALILFIKFIWAPLFWVVAWFRLKEKQI